MLRLERPLWEEAVARLGEPSAKAALETTARLFGSLFPTVTGPCDASDYSAAADVAEGRAASRLPIRHGAVRRRAGGRGVRPHGRSGGTRGRAGSQLPVRDRRGVLPVRPQPASGSPGEQGGDARSPGDDRERAGDAIPSSPVPRPMTLHRLRSRIARGVRRRDSPPPGSAATAARNWRPPRDPRLVDYPSVRDLPHRTNPRPAHYSVGGTAPSAWPFSTRQPPMRWVGNNSGGSSGITRGSHERPSNSETSTRTRKAAYGLSSRTAETWRVNCSPIGRTPITLPSVRQRPTPHDGPERCGLPSPKT